jgi:putative membrane protein
MKEHVMFSAKNLFLLTLAGASMVHFATAQTPPEQDSTSPSTASSPHQRDATGQTPPESQTTESSDPQAASTPHQNEVMSDAHGKMSTAPDPSGADPSSFVKKAALAGMTEVELGKLAASKGRSDAVRAFGERMVKDHGAANTELARIAGTQQLQVPKALDGEHKAIVEKLSAKSGSEFDAAYSQQMMADHAKAIALFEGATQSTDAHLAAFAKQTLPTLKEHQRMAHALAGADR